MTSERIDDFVKKLENDNDRLYNKFIYGKRWNNLNIQDKEDVWQNVLLKLTSENSNALDNYNHEINEKIGIYEDVKFRNWFYSCLNNACIDLNRKNNNRKKVGIDLQSIIDDEDDFDSNPMEMLAIDEESNPVSITMNGESYRLIFDELNKYIDKLTPKHRNALKKVYIDNLKYREAAELLNVSIGTVKSRVHVALKNLYKFYNDAA